MKVSRNNASGLIPRIRTAPMKPLTSIAAGLLGLLLLPGVTDAMSLLNGKSPLSAPWTERFQNVAKLNEYAKISPVELSNVLIENQKIDGAVLSGGQFQNTDWKSVSANKVNMNKTVFRGGTLEMVDFSDSTLSGVVFEDVRLVEVRFFGATLKNVRFVRCTFNGSNVDQLKASNIEVVDSKVIHTSLSEGELTAVFKNSQLYKGTKLTSLRLPSSLTFEKSDLDDVDLSRSVLNDLILDTVKSNKSGFDTGTISKVDITGGDISFGFTEAKIENIKIHDLNNVGLAFQDAVIKTMSLNKCRTTFNVNLFHARVGAIDVANCALNNFSPMEMTVDVLHISDGSIANSEFQKMKAKTLTLENVTLDGKLDFTNAHIGDLKVHNVTKQPGLQLITTGSNVRF